MATRQDRQAARVLGAPIVTEPDPLPHGGIGRTCRSDSDGEVYEQSVTGWCAVPPTRERLTLAGHHAGAVYLDPADGELVQVLPASAWREDRWGPLTAGLAVVKILVPIDRCEREGAIAQRDLTGWTRVPERVIAEIRARTAPSATGGCGECEGGVLFDRECPACGQPVARTCPCTGGEPEVES